MDFCHIVVISDMLIRSKDIILMQYQIRGLFTYYFSGMMTHGFGGVCNNFKTRNTLKVEML